MNYDDFESLPKYIREQFIEELEKKKKRKFRYMFVDAMNKRNSVCLFDLNNNLIMIFKTTKDCADYFNKDVEYINHNLKYCDKIRKDDEWFLKRRTNENDN